MENGYHEYRLLKSVGGAMHYAKVVVCFRDPLPSDASDVLIELRENVNEGQVTERSHSDWIEAAKAGVHAALALSKQSRPNRKVVMLVSVSGSDVDTSCNDVKKAAFYAAYKGVFPNVDLPSTMPWES